MLKSPIQQRLKKLFKAAIGFAANIYIYIERRIRSFRSLKLIRKVVRDS